jgi:hypothetical protein
MKHDRIKIVLQRSALAALLILVPALTVSAQSPDTAANATAPAPTWTTEQLITSTVHQAWLLSGKSEPAFFDMVKALAEISAKNRGITLPDNAEAGARAGNWIKMKAKQDPDQLLYVIVDQAVQYSARPHPATHPAKAAAPPATK